LARWTAWYRLFFERLDVAIQFLAGDREELGVQDVLGLGLAQDTLQLSHLQLQFLNLISLVGLLHDDDLW
jgi:hypothetical protein